MAPEGTDCCHQNCPVGTADCTLNELASFTGDYHRAGCMLSWCGSTDKCIEYCQTEDRCNAA